MEHGKPLKLLNLFFFFLFTSFISGEKPQGVSFRQVELTQPRQAIFILEVDPTQVDVIAAKAHDKEISGRETVLSIAKERNAYAAVNGGFFQIGSKKDGKPSGILKIDGLFYGFPTKPRGAIGWTRGDDVLIDQLLFGQGIPYTPYLISQDRAERWNHFRHIVGGTPMLIHNGKRITDFSSEKTQNSFLTGRHARTAVGIKADGTWVFVVVDGRRPFYSAGMTMEELAQWMESLGCTDALKLDGGGSSTLVLAGEVINQPYGDEDEGHVFTRKVSDAILILLKVNPSL